MCLLIVARNRIEAHPIALAANRDEALSRPWRPPERIDGEPARICPRDEKAGGTWVGVNTRGVVAAITNRRGPSHDERRPSRGLLCLEALGAPSAAAARGIVREIAAREPQNGFNLLVADASDAFLLTYGDGRMDDRPLRSGVHLLTNLHDLDPEELEDIRRAAEESTLGGLEAFEETARSLLSDHRAGPSGYAACKHGEAYGTVCSTLIWTSASGPPVIRFAPGPPCRTPFEPVRF